MKKSKFTETQIVSILKEADVGRPIKVLCRPHGIRDATYYNWKSKYGAMNASDLKRMKGMKEERGNAQAQMDEGKIFIANLSKGKLGEDGSALLGALLSTKFELAWPQSRDNPGRKSSRLLVVR